MQNAKIKLGSVRLSFPSLFKPASFNGESTGKYEATFILSKDEHADAIGQIKSQITELMKELKTKLPADKVCLRDGDETGRPEMAGCYSLKASTKKRPIVVNRDKTPITEDDNVVYAGCYVNAIVSLWAQNNGFGKRVNCQLDGVQFVRDGEPFGDAGISADAFDAFGEEEFTF
jgi:hypothetical protein